MGESGGSFSPDPGFEPSTGTSTTGVQSLILESLRRLEEKSQDADACPAGLDQRSRPCQLIGWYASDLSPQQQDQDEGQRDDERDADQEQLPLAGSDLLRVASRR